MCATRVAVIGSLAFWTRALQSNQRCGGSQEQQRCAPASSWVVAPVILDGTWAIRQTRARARRLAAITTSAIVEGAFGDG